MPKKNPAAVSLGRRGGLARAASLTAAELSDIGRLGGVPPKYRLRGERLERREGETWTPIPQPYGPAHREAIRRIKARP